jgi:hypothetical protein
VTDLAFVESSALDFETRATPETVAAAGWIDVPTRPKVTSSAHPSPPAARATLWRIIYGIPFRGATGAGCPTAASDPRRDDAGAPEQRLLSP